MNITDNIRNELRNVISSLFNIAAERLRQQVESYRTVEDSASVFVYPVVYNFPLLEQKYRQVIHDPCDLATMMSRIDGKSFTFVGENGERTIRADGCYEKIGDVFIDAVRMGHNCMQFNSANQLLVSIGREFQTMFTHYLLEKWLVPLDIVQPSQATVKQARACVNSLSHKVRQNGSFLFAKAAERTEAGDTRTPAHIRSQQAHDALRRMPEEKRSMLFRQLAQQLNITDLSECAENNTVRIDLTTPEREPVLNWFYAQLKVY